MATLIGLGDVLDAGQIASLVDQVPAGYRVNLAIDLTVSPAAAVVDGVKNALVNAGVPGVQVWSGSPDINISWIKEAAPVSGQIAQDPLTIIGIIIVALAVVAVFVIGWRLYEDATGILGPSAGLVLGIVLIAGAVALVGYGVSKLRNR